MRIVAVSAAIYSGYLICLVWALRREKVPILGILTAIMALTIALRLLYPHQFPWGFHEDEVKVTAGAFFHYCNDRLVHVMLNGLQGALYTAMIGPVYEPLGIWWAARWYSIVGSTLSVALGYGVARQLGFSATAAIAGVAVSYAVLPWSLLYGRTGLGCEVALNALVVLFALSKCQSSRSRSLVPAAVLLCFGLVLCCLEYTAGKVMLLAAPATLLTFPRKGWLPRAVVVTIACAAAVAVYGSLSAGRFVWYGYDASMLPPEARPGRMWLINLGPLLSALWTPLPWANVSQSITSVYVLPIPVVVLVGIGVFFGRPRRSIALLLFVLAVGSLPALFGPGGLSSHRLLTAAFVIPFFIAAAIDLVAAGRMRVVAALLVAATLLVWGPTTYFSSSFWTPYDLVQFCHRECILAPAGDVRASPPYFGNRPAAESCADFTRR